MTEDQFLHVADLFPDPALLLDRDGTILAANRAAKAFGSSSNTLTGRHLTEITATSAEAVASYLRLCARSRDPVIGSLLLGDEQGERQPRRCYGSLVRPAGADGSKARLLLRLTANNASPTHFSVLNQKINQLTEEVRRRKLVEEQLRDVNDWLAVTLASIGDAIIVTDNAGLVTFLNPIAEKLTGWKLDEAKGQPLDDVFRIVNEYHRKAVENPVHRVLRDGVIVGLANHTVLIAKDGAETPIDDSAAPIRGTGGQIDGVVLVFRDVTERKAAEQAVRRQAEVMSGVLAATVDHIYVVDRDGKYLFVSAGGAKILGYSPEEIVGKDWREIGLSAEAMEPFNTLRDKAIETGSSSFGETVFKDSQDETLYFEYVVSPLSGQDEKPQAVVVISRDATERRRAEKDLRLQARVLESMSEGVSVTDENGVILYTNPAEDRMFGYATGELLGQHVTVQNAYPPDENERRVGEVIECLKEGGAWIGEWSNRRKNGESFTSFARITALELGDERFWVCVQEDVTERKRADEALRESEERLRIALTAGSMGVWDWNIVTNELRWSDNLESMHGLQPGTFDGTFGAFQKLIHPDDASFVNETVHAALEQRGGYDIEFRTIWPDGSVHWMSGKGKVLVESDEPVRMVGVGMDITARKRAENDTLFLARASATLAGLVDYQSTLQVVARLAVPHFADWATVDMLDEDGLLRRLAVAHIDPAKVELAHEVYRRFPPDPTSPTGVWNILRTGEAEIIPEITDELLVASVTDDELLDILRDLGLKSYMGVPLTVRGNTLGVITFIASESGRRYADEDLSLAKDLAHRAAVAVENSRLYEALKDADRRKDEFLATLAHELRNPLAPIRTGLEVLKLSGQDRRIAADTQAMMEKQLEHMVRLIDDLLEISRITRGKLQLRKSRVELGTAIQNAIEATRPLLDEAGHKLWVNLPTTPIHIDADATRLVQVFSNLLSNAGKYSDRGSSIWLTLDRRNGEAVVTVRDEGVGIPAEHLSRIFEMFSQVDSALDRSKGGLGIGLSLVKALVEMHGGSVEAKSEGLGRGSEFIVRFPATAALTDSVSYQQTSQQPTFQAKRKILVVDDNHDAAITLAMLLKILGNDVSMAHDGAEAITMAEAVQPHMVLMDIGMPGVNGYEAAYRIRQTAWGRQITLVAVSGWGQDEDKRRAMEAGFDHHLTKPVEATAVKDLLASIL